MTRNFLQDEKQTDERQKEARKKNQSIQVLMTFVNVAGGRHHKDQVFLPEEPQWTLRHKKRGVNIR